MTRTRRRGGIFIRYLDNTQTGTTVGLQIALRRSDTKLAANLNPLPLPIGKPSTIQLTYDGISGKASVTVNDGNPISMNWGTDGTAKLAWPDAKAVQPFVFQGRRGDEISEFKVESVENGTYKQVWLGDKVDLETAAAWKGLRRDANLMVTALAGCSLSTPPADLPEKCSTVKDGRNTITEIAKTLALAYRLTGDAQYRTAALKHIALMMQVQPFETGGEWNMSARVGAMGVYYDWFHDDTEFPDAVRQQLVARIKDTISADLLTGPNPNDDLIYSVCGPQKLSTDAYRFDCDVKPVFAKWDRNERPQRPSLAPQYISGHSASAMSMTLLGLLAIVKDGHPEVQPMIDTIYEHFRQGLLPAREFYAVDGGNHTAFAYAGSGGGDMVERMLVWNKAAEDDNAGLTANFLPKLIYPYIYGLRSDGSFPARGDAFDYDVAGIRDVGAMALGAVVGTGDGYAQTFYRDHIARLRQQTSSTTLWERLLYPNSVAPKELTDLKLSAHFRVAGNVLMRDTWNYQNATLLEFKSSSFISENHQHLDQNSFSLAYKAPLLLDSGKYDEYLTVHWKNYYQRSVAHNTVLVYDETETFKYDDNADGTWSNDGGQWYNGRPTYPTIEEAQGINRLDGVTAYEDGGDYAVVTGNASKAYSGNKLDQAEGFVRSIVYLRGQNAGTDKPQPPTIVVFDKVKATKALAATSLLHMVNQPAALTAPKLSTIEPGHFQYDASAGRAFTVRNGGGMVTVQSLLPAGAKVELVGGLDVSGSSCPQSKLILTDKTVLPETPSGSDCRFLARKVGADGKMEWRNFRIRPDGPKSTTDIGNWRLEFSPSTVPAAGEAQHFLSVMHVADNDLGSGVAQITSAELDNAADGAVAVKVPGTGDVIVFKTDAAKQTISWSAKASRTIVVGLKPNQSYMYMPGSQILIEATSGSPVSSAAGVLVLQ